MAAPRAQWKGFLKLDNITCQVKLTGVVTEAEKIHFHILNRKTRERVKSAYVDEDTGKTVEHDDQVKGFELSDGEFLVIDPKEIERLKQAGEHRLDLDGFVKRADVLPLYLEKPYYLYPADKVAVEPFALIRDAMVKSDVVAVGHIVMLQRERSVLVEPCERGMLVTMLRQPNEVVKEKPVFDGIPKTKADADVAELGEMLIERKRSHFDPSKFEDRYEAALARMIEAKKKGKAPPKAAPKPEVTNVIDIAKLLQKSLSEGKSEGAKSGTAKTRKVSTRKSAGKTRRKAA